MAKFRIKLSKREGQSHSRYASEFEGRAPASELVFHIREACIAKVNGGFEKRICLLIMMDVNKSDFQDNFESSRYVSLKA